LLASWTATVDQAEAGVSNEAGSR
ncbi:MAG: hypothetical protein QOC98_2667, partial [Frankiaceae bacterium]|nr:hypothetical protein [Frankiaceae bacterium]